MRTERDYKLLDVDRDWRQKTHLQKMAKKCGYKYITEAVEAEYNRNLSQAYTGYIFDMSESWAKQTLNYIGVERHGVGAPSIKMSDESRKEFIDGYDGEENKMGYCHAFLKSHSWIDISTKTLERLICRKAARVTDEDMKNLNFKVMDSARSWAYRDDLLEIAGNMGCEYITEAFHKAHKKSNFAADLGLIFERTPAWAISVMNYMGLEKRTIGGRHR